MYPFVDDVGIVPNHNQVEVALLVKATFLLVQGFLW